MPLFESEFAPGDRVLEIGKSDPVRARVRKVTFTGADEPWYVVEYLEYLETGVGIAQGFVHQSHLVRDNLNNPGFVVDAALKIIRGG